MNDQSLNITTARTHLANWLRASVDASMMEQLGVLPMRIRRDIGLSEWQPILETSMGPEVGRARFMLLEEAYCWHLDDENEVVEHDPRFRIVQGDRAVVEYFRK